MGMKVKMRISLKRVCSILHLLVLLVLFTCGNTSKFNPERDRNKHSSSANFDLMDHRFHHDDDDILSSASMHHDSDSHLHSPWVCEPIKISLCVGIGYNQTTMPNLVGHDSQSDAESLLQTFSPLIQYGCSSNLKLFLCSAHVPMCTDKIPQPIGPCRSLCESVKSKCEPVLKEFGFEWPESLECSKFHQENNHENLCNPGPSESHYRDRGSAISSGGKRERDPTIPSERFPSSTGYGDSHYNAKASGSGSRQNQNPTFGTKNSQFKPNNNNNNNKEAECVGPRKLWVKGSCFLKCSAASLDPQNADDSSLFHTSEKSFARNYALLWAVLSLSAAFIALTLSVCSPRFSVAERPILYIALCQVLYSIGVIIGSTSSVSCVEDKLSGSNLLARGGMIPSSSCAFVFLLTYFFGTAQIMWWVILCLSLLLSLNRNMASSLQKESSLFHLVTWGVASILTSTALVHKKVDADELTGICGVGFQDTEALTLYNLIPLSISLSIGLIFLTFGLVVKICFPTWNLPLCKLKFLKRNSSTSAQNRMAGCELSNNSAATTTASHQTGQTNTHLHQNGYNNNRGQPQMHQGYSPVLVMPPPQLPQSHPPNYHGGLGFPTNCHIDRHMDHHHGHFINSPCVCSGGVCGGMSANNNNALYSTGNSPASVVGVGGFQRLRALENNKENTKAIWMRIGIFALVHSLPIACQVGTMMYELSGRDDWEKGKERPNLQIFLLRLNMNLIAGLTTGVWVLSTYSWKSLLMFARKICNCLQFPQSKTKTKPHEQQKLPVPQNSSSVVAPLLTQTTHQHSQSHSSGSFPPIPVPSGSSSSSNARQESLMPILGSNNTFTSRGAFAPHNIPSATNFPRYNHPLPPVPPRNPDHIAAQQQQQGHHRTDAWRRGETMKQTIV